MADFDSFTAPNWKLKKSQSGPFVSLNRFERKKNIELAINALAVLKQNMEKKNTIANMNNLIIAGSIHFRIFFFVLVPYCHLTLFVL